MKYSADMGLGARYSYRLLNGSKTLLVYEDPKSLVLNRSGPCIKSIQKIHLSGKEGSKFLKNKTNTVDEED